MATGHTAFGRKEMATVIRYDENEDGSAEVQLDLSTDEVKLLLTDAITRAFESYIDEVMKEIDNE